MIELLVDADRFWPRLRADLQGARKAIALQTMSLEGDRAGWQLQRALRQPSTAYRRVLIDGFTQHILSCRFLYSPRNLLDRAVRQEVAATRRLVQDLEANGAEVRFCNRAGLLWRKLPARNHKKSIVIDSRIAYVGGFNFSDHNFAWHDLMIRIENERIARFLEADFEATWRGEAECDSLREAGVELLITNGRSNERSFSRVLDLIDAARDSVLVHSPYLTFPFCPHLRSARARGVAVTVVSPAVNTIPVLARYIAAECQRGGFRHLLFPGMTHLKAMLVDGRWLVLGSSNFDYLSYRRHQEILAIITDPLVISNFARQVLAPDFARCQPAEPRVFGWADRLRSARLHATGAALSVLAA